MTTPRALPSQIEPSPAQVACYDAGRQAYTDGLPSTAVQALHPAGSESRLLWLRGYTLARRDDLYGPPEED